ncbi:hypothetical protein RND81_02G031700 [Saponaria officinalis]|uniref:Pentatricopeptide repeat-containing protein n=1 Tax=Saponaria officinalis TaxID=3572 RepID=A0AAW1MQ10_SAPOF
MNKPLLAKHVSAVIKHQKDPLKALETFKSVKNEDGFKHNLSTYKCMVDKLGSHGKFEAMEFLLSDMRVDIDNRMVEAVYIGAMKSYGKRGKVQEAVNVFERMDFYNCEPSVMSYNAIMNILVEHRHYVQAHKVYLRLKERRITPDVYTYTIRIKLFCRTARFNAALRLLNSMASQGCDVNAVTYCTIVGGLYEDEYEVEALKLFCQMLSLEICPDITTFNKLINVLCRKGDVRETERLLSKVFKRGISPNLFTYNIFIEGLCEKKSVNEAANLLCIIRREDFTPDVVSYNLVIRGLCKNGKVVEAERYLHQMINKGFDPDAFTYNSIINAYCKSGMVQNADMILRDAVFKGFVPDVFTYCSLIEGLCKIGDVERAMTVFDEAETTGLTRNVVLYNTIIKGLSQQGLILEALQFINEMLRIGCYPGIWTYNTVINGLCKMGCLADANNLVDDAMTRGCLPDIFTFNTLIDGYCKQLKLDTAIEIIGKMWDYGAIPDVITYNTLLDGLCKKSEFDAVMGIFETMVSKGCRPNVITYNILIETHCKFRKLDEALQLLEQMKQTGLAPDLVTFGTLINGYCKIGDLTGACQIFRKCDQVYGLSHTVATYNILISACSEKLSMDMARSLFHEMVEKGCLPDNYTYCVLIDGFCKAGRYQAGYKYLLDGIEKGFRLSLVTCGRVLNCLCVKHRVREAVGVIQLMARKGIVPGIVENILNSAKREIAAPKIIVEDLLKKSCIAYYTYEVLYDGIRDKKLRKKSIS